MLRLIRKGLHRRGRPDFGANAPRSVRTTPWPACSQAGARGTGHRSVGSLLRARSARRGPARCQPGGRKFPPPTGERSVDRAEKQELVTTLNGVFKDAEIVVVAHYSGLTVAQMTTLRRQMKAEGAGLKVAKNRLAKIALEGTDVAAHRVPAQGTDGDRLFRGSGGGGQGRRRLRQGERKVRDPRRRDGQRPP